MYFEKDWSGEPYSRGCAGVLGQGVDRLRPRPPGARRSDSLGGTETATRWMGYLDGAIQSGRRAAAEVIRAEGAALTAAAGAGRHAARMVPGG